MQNYIKTWKIASKALLQNNSKFLCVLKTGFTRKKIENI